MDDLIIRRLGFARLEFISCASWDAELTAARYARCEMAHTPYPQTDREILRLIERSAGHRAGYKQLVRELGLGGGRERRLLLEQLARITARGELVRTADEQWSLPAATPEKTARATKKTSTVVGWR